MEPSYRFIIRLTLRDGNRGSIDTTNVKPFAKVAMLKNMAKSCHEAGWSFLGTTI
jgi:hypothetical protein